MKNIIDRYNINDRCNNMLPCPKCGSKVMMSYIENNTNLIMSYIIKCESCDYKTSQHVSIAEIIKQHNTNCISEQINKVALITPELQELVKSVATIAIKDMFRDELSKRASDAIYEATTDWLHDNTDMIATALAKALKEVK